MALPSVELPDLDFRPGFGVQSAVKNRLNSLINFSPGNGTSEFFLLASFGRCVYRLNEESVGFILQATLGGIAADFRPMQLKDRVFRFSVSSKDVGFHIYRLQSYECKQYKIFFNLWNSGGAKWSAESQRYAKEEADSWSEVVSKRTLRSRKSYAAVAKSGRSQNLTGANKVPLGQKKQWKARQSVFSRISQPRTSVFDRLQDQVPAAKNKDLIAAPNSNSSDARASMTNRPPAIEMKTAQIVRAQHPNRPSIIICGKCLKSGHQTKSCWGIIKCRRCSKDGHISFNCPSPPENKGFSPTILPSDNFQRIWKVPNPESWFRKQPLTDGPSTSGPRTFPSFTAWASIFHVISEPFLQQEMIGVEPANEAPFLAAGGGLNPFYDFFGFGQAAQNSPPFQGDQVNNEDPPQNAANWGQCINLGLQQDNAPNQVINLNEVPDDAELQMLQVDAVNDGDAINEVDDQENPEPGEAFIDLNDFVQNLDNDAGEQEGDMIHALQANQTEDGPLMPKELYVDMLQELVAPLQPPQEMLLQPQPLNVAAPIAVPEPNHNVNSEHDDNFDHIQLGIVQIIDAHEADPVFEAFTHHEDVQPWVPKVNADSAWDIIKSGCPPGLTLNYTMPHSCPLSNGLLCNSKEITQFISDDMNEPKTPPICPRGKGISSMSRKIISCKKLISTPPVVTSDVRRSERLKKKSKGFKTNSCTDRRCVTCTAEPPNLTPSIIRNLGETFCKIKPVALSETALTKTSKIKSVIGDGKEKAKKAGQIKTPKNKNQNNEDKTKKKPKRK
ncbi:hypothetical protein EJB05_44742, partial [Eragrostis curvula]